MEQLVKDVHVLSILNYVTQKADIKQSHDEGLPICRHPIHAVVMKGGSRSQRNVGNQSSSARPFACDQGTCIRAGRHMHHIMQGNCMKLQEESCCTEVYLCNVRSGIPMASPAPLWQLVHVLYIVQLG